MKAAAPYIVIVVMACLLWGGFGYWQAAKKEAQQATERAEKSDAQLEAAKAKAKDDAKLLEDREKQAIADRKRMASLEQKIKEFNPNEECLDLDAVYPWLDGLLSDGAAVPPRPDR